MKNGKSMKRIMIKIGNMIGRGLGLRRAPVFQGFFLHVFFDQYMLQ